MWKKEIKNKDYTGFCSDSDNMDRVGIKLNFSESDCLTDQTQQKLYCILDSRTLFASASAKLHVLLLSVEILSNRNKTKHSESSAYM